MHFENITGRPIDEQRRQGWRKKLVLAQVVLSGCLFGGVVSAQATSAVNGAAPPPSLPVNNSQRLEVEIVEAHSQIGIPSEIHRKTGKFVLAVANRSQDPTAWFVVDVAPTAQATAAPGHVLTIGSGQLEHRHRAAAVFDAQAGTYELKNGATGKVLCTIVIE